MIRCLNNRDFFRYLTILTALLCLNSYARTPEEPEFHAAEVIGEDVADWIIGLEKRPNSVGIFSVRANFPLEADYATVIETEVVKYLAKEGMEKVTTCPECRAPQVTVDGERIVISKGLLDLETLKKIGRTQPVDSFLIIDIYRTKLSVVAQAVLYANTTGNLIAAERFSVPALNISDASAQLLLTLGIGKSLGAPSSADSGFTLASNISLLEELGFGKGGLNVGATMGGPSTLIYVNPTFGFRGRFGASAMSWLFSIGAGFGFTGGGKGISVRGSFEIFLGSFAVFGLEASYLVPEKSSIDAAGFGGAHLGISLGR